MAALPECRVVDVMTCRPLAVTRETPLADILQVLEEHDFNSVPVIEEGALLGVVTKLDALRVLAASAAGIVPPYERIRGLPAERIMTEPAVTIGPKASVSEVVQRMIETGNRSIPVVIGALLVGIVTRRDVLRAVRGAGAP